MNIDAEALLNEVAQQAAQAATKTATYAGQIGFLTKRVAELEAQLADKDVPQKKE